MAFSKIVNPKTGRKVSTNSKLGKQILNNYINQLGGHNGPCAINSDSGKCKKSKKADGKCEVSEKGRCRKIKKTKKKPIKDDFYNESWATVENYSDKITPKILKERRQMIDEIYSLYNEYKKVNKISLHPDDWRYPPQWCYKEQLINNLNGYREDLIKAAEEKSEKIPDIVLDDDELMAVINNFIPEEYNNPKYMGKALVELKKIKYDPEYTSLFGLGEPINIESAAERLSKYIDESKAELLNDPYVHSQALIGQIVDQMGEEGYWSDLLGSSQDNSGY